ncbi:MAG: hypothetical protein LBB82_11320 [Treponema sp.]|nr:hypothetical protein [Treponema sp.]
MKSSDMGRKTRRYTGQTENGYNMRYRYLNPQTTGRWLSTDLAMGEYIPGNNRDFTRRR